MAVNSSGFDFETSFDYDRALRWMTGHWTLSFLIASFYVSFVFWGPYLMKDHRGFRLQRTLLTWNMALATFSVMGAFRMVPEAVSSLRNFGFQHSVCDSSFFTGTSGLWAWLFVLSKVPELGDTVFLVLRKRPIPFLHWYHHTTVLCYVWYSYMGSASTGRWFAAMNYSVHALMYSYYALKAGGVRVPSLISVVITALQLIQMALGCFLTYWSFRTKARGEFCDVSNGNLMASMIMYLSYFVLFVQFFYSSYLVKGHKIKKME